jgi:membrane protein DedA with SNARE-associated domain
MTPGGAAYTYLGYAGREVAGGGEDLVRKALLAIAVVATIAFASRVIMRLRQRKTDQVE